MTQVQTAALPNLDALRPASITDRVYEALYDRVIDHTLAPGTRLSEAEVAAQMGVSRQPVRDAFFRLSQLGFIQIRPQRATTVTPISVEAVMQARFIRSALEVACVREAAVRLTEADLSVLEAIIAEQEDAAAADRRQLFHALDDRLHREICERAGLGFVWSLIKDNKGHMDRVRFLSLAFGAPSALSDHRALLAAIRSRDPDAAEAQMREHLDRIRDVIDRIRRDNPAVFEEDGPPPPRRDGR